MLQDQSMKENGLTIKHMDQVYLAFQMEIAMKENGSRERKMVLGKLITLMDRGMKVSQIHIKVIKQ